MELKIKKTELIKALQLINSITDKSSTKPILSNFLLKTLPEAEGINGASCVEFSATDYEVSLIVKFEGDHQNPLSLSLFAISPAILGEGASSVITLSLVSKTLTQG